VGLEPTTVIDLTGETPVLLRRGKGDVSIFSIEE
jgi:tRNA A37 threonylcarbamoyladenosine synthetase subunit TsaC/SUA5/YrdC